MNRFLLLASYFLFFSLSPLSNLYASGVSSKDYENGEELYDLGCAICHGKNMINLGTSSFDLRVFPKDDKSRFIESVANGTGYMPAMGDVFDSQEIEQLWIYISGHQ
jgi:mono/diheme cytochrome c family protein